MDDAMVQFGESKLPVPQDLYAPFVAEQRRVLQRLLTEADDASPSDIERLQTRAAQTAYARVVRGNEAG
jgi:hypothetical protein